MRKFVAFLLVLVFAGSLLALDIEVTSSKPQAGNFDQKADEVVSDPAIKPGEFVVKFKNTDGKPLYKLVSDSISRARTEKASGFDKLLEEIGAVYAGKAFEEPKKSDKVFNELDLGDVAVLKVSSDQDTEQVSQELSQFTEQIEYVAPVRKYYLALIPNDPYWDSSGAWGQAYQDVYGLHLINAAGAWDVTRGANVVVAVIDTGVDFGHTELQGQFWVNEDEVPANGKDDDNNGYVDDVNGWNFVENNKNPVDDFGHGTHCAGTIAAVMNNGRGVAGVAPNVKIMPLRGLSAAGGDSVKLAQAIRYAVDNGADVLSNSWGGFGYDPILADAVAYAIEHGTVFIASAGNANSQVEYFVPASFDGVIAVAASDWNDQRAAFSNYGDKIAVTAPGVNVLSLRAAGTDMYATPDNPSPTEHVIPQGNSNGEYYYASGTSMSAPHAAGVAALVKSVHPEYSPNQVALALTISADDVQDSGFDVYSGYGRVNAFKAVQTTVVDLGFDITPDYPNGQIHSYGFIKSVTTGWKLEYGQGKNPSAWIKIASGSSMFDEKLIASVDLNSLQLDYYTFKFSATAPSGEVSFSLKTFDNRYPIVFSFERSVTNYGPGADAVLADVNGDGDQELFALGGDFQLYAWDGNSQLLPGYPVDIPAWISEKSCTRVVNPFQQTQGISLGDVDGDGKLEVVVGISDALLVYEAENGALKWGKSSSVGASTIPRCPFIGRPTLTDLNNDGVDEILSVAAFFSYYVEAPWGPKKVIELRAYSGAGALLWSKNLVKTNSYSQSGEDFCTQNIFGSPPYPSEVSVADIDNDNFVEVLLGSGQYFYAFNHDGSLAWEKTMPNVPGLGEPGRTCVAPVVADLENDGFKEIILEDNCLTLRVWDGAGNEKWAVRKSQPAGKYCGTFEGRTPAVADFDNDGFLEIVQAPHETKVADNLGDGFVFTSTGQQYSTFTTPCNPAGQGFCYASPTRGEVITGDFDNDGTSEIAFMNGFTKPQIFVKETDGTDLAGWPLVPSNLVAGVEYEAPFVSQLFANGEIQLLYPGRGADAIRGINLLSLDDKKQYDPTGLFVTQSQFDVASTSYYKNYCNNGVKDDEEQGVDCGDVCGKACIGLSVTPTPFPSVTPSPSVAPSPIPTPSPTATPEPCVGICGLPRDGTNHCDSIMSNLDAARYISYRLTMTNFPPEYWCAVYQITVTTLDDYVDDPVETEKWWFGLLQAAESECKKTPVTLPIEIVTFEDECRAQGSQIPPYPFPSPKPGVTPTPVPTVVPSPVPSIPPGPFVCPTDLNPGDPTWPCYGACNEYGPRNCNNRCGSSMSSMDAIRWVAFNLAPLFAPYECEAYYETVKQTAENPEGPPSIWWGLLLTAESTCRQPPVPVTMPWEVIAFEDSCRTKGVPIPPWPAPSPIPSVQPTPSSTPTVIPSPTPTVVPSPTLVPSPTPSIIPTPSPSKAPSPTPSVAPSPVASPTPSVVPSPSPSKAPSPTPTVIPSPIPSPSPSKAPSPTPTIVPSPVPSPTPTVIPSPVPSPTPTVIPSPTPTASPSPSPGAPDFCDTNWLTIEYPPEKVFNNGLRIKLIDANMYTKVAVFDLYYASPSTWFVDKGITLSTAAGGTKIYSKNNVKIELKLVGNYMVSACGTSLGSAPQPPVPTPPASQCANGLGVGSVVNLANGFSFKIASISKFYGVYDKVDIDVRGPGGNTLETWLFYGPATITISPLRIQLTNVQSSYVDGCFTAGGV
ncbi:MAG: S8 family serine peptidase [Candidatus Micrarchaeota archaeon]